MLKHDAYENRNPLIEVLSFTCHRPQPDAVESKNYIRQRLPDSVKVLMVVTQSKLTELPGSFPRIEWRRISVPPSTPHLLDWWQRGGAECSHRCCTQSMPSLLPLRHLGASPASPRWPSRFPYSRSDMPYVKQNCPTIIHNNNSPIFVATKHNKRDWMLKLASDLQSMILRGEVEGISYIDISKQLYLFIWLCLAS